MYNNPNNKIIEIKLRTILCRWISLCKFHEVWSTCNKVSTSIACRVVARRDCMFSSVWSVGVFSSCRWCDSCYEIIGALSGRKICGVSSSVCIDPRSVVYICKSSVDKWQADALNSMLAFTSTCVRGGLASFPVQRTDRCRGVGKWYIHWFRCRIIVDDLWLRNQTKGVRSTGFGVPV
jgi:hypothetical protein